MKGCLYGTSGQVWNLRDTARTAKNWEKNRINLKLFVRLHPEPSHRQKKTKNKTAGTGSSPPWPSKDKCVYLMGGWKRSDIWNKWAFIWTCIPKTWNNLDQNKQKNQPWRITSLSIAQHTARAAQWEKWKVSWEAGKQDSAALSKLVTEYNETSSNQCWEEETSSTSAGVSAGLAEARL